MKIFFYFFFLFISCNTIKIVGVFSDGNNTYEFKENPNEYEYFYIGEMGLHHYSKGTWELKNKNLTLNGFSIDSLKSIPLKITGIYKNNDSIAKLQINYSLTKKNFPIVTDIIIDNKMSFRISNDTILNLNSSINTIRFKSYFFYSEYLTGTPPKNATLYSSILNVKDIQYQKKTIVLAYSINPNDFYRIDFKDTMKLTNKYLKDKKNSKIKKVIFTKGGGQR